MQDFTDAMDAAVTTTDSPVHVLIMPPAIIAAL